MVPKRSWELDPTDTILADTSFRHRALLSGRDALVHLKALSDPIEKVATTCEEQLHVFFFGCLLLPMDEVWEDAKKPLGSTECQVLFGLRRRSARTKKSQTPGEPGFRSAGEPRSRVTAGCQEFSLCFFFFFNISFFFLGGCVW